LRLFDRRKCKQKLEEQFVLLFPTAQSSKLMQNYLVQVLTIDWNVNQTSWSTSTRNFRETSEKIKRSTVQKNGTFDKQFANASM